MTDETREGVKEQQGEGKDKVGGRDAETERLG